MSKRTRLPFFAPTLIGLSLLLFSASAVAQTKLLRFPTFTVTASRLLMAVTSGPQPANGGTAIRLTAHPGIEVFAKFSPDGKWIAFTGQYDGDEQVYVIPSTGGVPRQLTFYPAKGPLTPRWGWDNQVYGWSKDGTHIFFQVTARFMDAADCASLHRIS